MTDNIGGNNTSHYVMASRILHKPYNNAGVYRYTIVFHIGLNIL